MKLSVAHRFGILVSPYFPAAIALAAFVPNIALADFSGNDKLAAASSNWKEYSGFGDPGGAKFVFQNSRLEYLAKSPTAEDLVVFRWTPNEGESNQNWFVQVDAHFDMIAVSKNCWSDLTLAVFNQSSKQGYYVSMDRYKDGGPNPKFVSDLSTGFINSNSPSQSVKSPALDATLRIHFDSVAKTLTASCKTASGRTYFTPAKVAKMEMTASDTLTAGLAGDGGSENNSQTGPVIQSGEAFFTNFKAGDATPDIAVEQPVGSDLTDSTSKKSFGTVVVGGLSTPKTFIVRNTGTSKLKNLQITKNGPNAGDFNVSGPAKTLLDPGESTAFDVVFNPQAVDTRKAAIHVTSNDPDEASFDVDLTGLGVN